MKKIIITAVIIVLILIAAASGIYIFFEQINNQQAAEDYSSLSSKYDNASAAAETTAAQATDSSGVPAEPNPIDFASLQQNENSDIYAWIKVPGTRVDYPVLRSETNDNFYIDHGVNKEYSFAGAIYSQFCNRRDFKDRVTVLYGHNMADNSMFASLHSFEDADFFAQNRDMTIYTPDKELSYEIVSAYVGDDSHIMNSYDFYNDEVFIGFLDNIMNPHSVQSNVRDGVSLGINDRIVILSTCLNYGEGRYLVAARLVSEKPLVPAQ